MKKELSYFEVFPKILKSDENTHVTIRPLGRQSAFNPEADYLLRFLPMDESLEPLDDDHYESILIKADRDGALRFKHAFRGEQEHIIRVLGSPDTGHVLGNFHVYSLKNDLFSRKPYRGDFHVHSHLSDGVEAPEIAAANYRRNGFDFMAITDHYKMYPSEEAQKAYEGISIDLKLFNGEEVHSPGNHIHIVNFGGSFSVNELASKNRGKYECEVAEIIKRTEIPAGVNAFEYAASVWVFDRIREGGGLAIFAHPYWIPNVYHVPQKLVDLFFEKKPFDAFELIGGHEVYSNNMQTAYYSEMRSRGMNIPMVGSSDSHGTEDTSWFNWFYTILFSGDLEFKGIKDAVTDFYNVAVECYPGEECRIYGSFRMVKYARFLLNEYFPLHDALCFEEGRLMKDFICGDEKAKDLLGMMMGRTGRLMKRCFGETE